MNQETKIYPEHDHLVSRHNVVGKDGVLWSADQEVQDAVGGHYDYRAVDGFFLDGNRQGHVLTQNNSPEFVAQMTYRGEIANANFTPIGSFTELFARPHERVLYIPYIRLQDPEFPNANWISYGLPPEVTHRAKNKRIFHEWLANAGFAEHIPNFVATHIDAVAERGKQMIEQVTNLYHEAGMQNYPVGLMIRGAECDGNYGAVVLKQDTIRIGTFCPEKQKILLMPDGKSKGSEYFDDWESALKAATTHIKTSMDIEKEPNVLMTRLVELERSPGMAAVMRRGIMHCLEWNDQWKAQDETACTGTSSYRAMYGMDEEKLQQSQILFTEIMGKMMTNTPNRESVYAMFNIDLMMVSQKEDELWKDPTQILISFHGTLM